MELFASCCWWWWWCWCCCCYHHPSPHGCLTGWMVLCSLSSAYGSRRVLYSPFSLSISFQTIWCHHHLHYFSFVYHIYTEHVHISPYIAITMNKSNIRFGCLLSHVILCFIFICATSIRPLNRGKWNAQRERKRKRWLEDCCLGKCSKSDSTTKTALKKPWTSSKFVDFSGMCCARCVCFHASNI